MIGVSQNFTQALGVAVLPEAQTEAVLEIAIRAKPSETAEKISIPFLKRQPFIVGVRRATRKIEYDRLGGQAQHRLHLSGRIDGPEEQLVSPRFENHRPVRPSFGRAMKIRIIIAIEPESTRILLRFPPERSDNGDGLVRMRNQAQRKRRILNFSTCNAREEQVGAIALEDLLDNRLDKFAVSVQCKNMHAP